jgi:hypothetical protein
VEKHAQGIEAVSFFAIGKKDTSGKPGFRRKAPEMRPFPCSPEYFVSRLIFNCPNSA